MLKEAVSEMNSFPDPALGEPFLLTPGPLTTAYEVKEAMLKDWGSWDGDFRAITASIRQKLLQLADAEDEFVCVPMQGSGTFSVEAMLGTFLSWNTKALVLLNGAYGKRIVETLEYLGRDYVAIDKGDYLPPRGEEVEAAIEADPSITHVIVVHVETSSGILNPIEEIAEVTERLGRTMLIDSMSAFGAMPIDFKKVRFDALVSSANKCIEGVPGFGFVLARREALEACDGNSHSLSLDIYKQWIHMEKTGQWRFTPPTHTVTAFLTALELYEQEGGVEGRYNRYRTNRDTLVSGMRALGFETLLDDRWLSPIIVTFFCPADPSFDFNRFYEGMKDRGFIIYPGKLTVVDSFRVGCIGRMDNDIMERVVEAARATLADMGVENAAPPALALEERAKLLNK
ncbi:2-aminoethylphosphonate--pyruvate transaminase [Coralliovum pocilloporae]|uniref:2-aminoethylphosphonate--pyruvate transaminase n=1 Tax=Coralliovum pocilloporae TaxID=3066369 RepID=UPI0033075DD9